MATNRDRETREARERRRRYEARQQVHDRRVRRRRIDNVAAAGILVVVAALATVAQVFYFTAGPGQPDDTPIASADPSASAEPTTGENVGDVPDAATAEGRTWSGELVLNDTVTLGVSLDGALAPQATASLVQDVTSGYFTGKTCHRLVASDTAGLIQCGSIDGTGSADPEYAFGPVENAPVDGVYTTGTIAMARGESDYSNGHQFFIVFGDSQLQSSDALGYTVVGTVTSGLDQLTAQITDAGVADGATDGAPNVATTITGFTIA